ncbi:MAG TPA: ABC transporter permease, partial [Bacteroidales bacterium]
MKHFIFNSIIRSKILKLKQSTIINLIGLSFGFAVLFYIIFFIRDELSYNQFHKNIDNIYCIYTYEPDDASNETVPALPDALRKEYPEVKDAALIYNSKITMLMSFKNQKYYEKVQLTEPNLFNILSFPILKGNIISNPDQNNVIAISKKMAAKYFGSQNPIGDRIKINNKEQATVIAVFIDIPKNSSIRFDFWMPVKLLEKIKNKDYLNTWYNLSFSGYVLLNEHSSFAEVNKRLTGRIKQSNPGSNAQAQLYPFKNLYLDKYRHQKSINMMILIASVITILICINFINLQIAEAFKRIKEYGVKKINGAKNIHIYKELIEEAIIYVSIAIVAALFMTYLSVDYMKNLIGKSSSNNQVISVNSVCIITIVGLAIAFLSGLIPGLTIKAISLQNSLKEKISEKISIKKLRYAFISLQFCISIALLICLFVIQKQVNYLKNKDLGFNKEQILYVDLNGNLEEKYDLLKKEIDRNPAILSSSLASRSPIGIYWNGGGWNWEGKPDDSNPQITFIETDKDFQKTFGIIMKEGSYFQDEKLGVVINETFAKMVSPKGSAMYKILSDNEDVKVPIIGIIDDFNFKPLNEKIGPLMLIPKLGYDKMRYLFIRIHPNNMINTLQFIESTVTKINPDFPYQRHFLDDDFDNLYNNEKKLRDQIMFFSIMAILISCIGLWGILLFIIKQYSKEIGIRKVNGALISEVLLMLNKDFIKWVTIAFIIACPIAWYAMHQ